MSTTTDDNKRNALFFEAASMRELYECISAWKETNRKRLLSLAINNDGGVFCCIALTNPTEVVITSPDGNRYAEVLSPALFVRNYED